MGTASFIVLIILILAYAFVIFIDHHLPRWVEVVVTVALAVALLNGLVRMCVRHYERTHRTPPTVTVWFPDVPVKNLGESTARLAIVAGSEQAVTVICPKWFDPDTSRTYTADNFKLETGDGRLTPITWELRITATPNH